MYNIFVYIEKYKNSIRDVSLELISHCASLNCNDEISIWGIYPSSDITDELKDEIFSSGASGIYFIKHEKLSEYNEELYAKAILDFVSTKKPDVFLFGATKRGRALAPKISSSLMTGLTADCTNLELIEKNNEIKLASTRPTFGGSLMAVILSKRKPEMATVREHVLKKKNFISNNGIILEYRPELSNIENKIELIESIKEKNKINDAFLGAEIILSGGLGLGTAENFRKLECLANFMNASCGGTRGAVDRGYISKDKQIGQTGKTVSPKIYVAFGISGAIQHLCGIENSDYIIAVNNDKNAPIFKNCDLGILGDASKIIDELLCCFDKTL